MPGFEFKRADPAAKKWAEDHAADLITGIGKTTRDAIETIIVDAFEEGTPVEEIASEIDAFLDDPARSEMIARTETMRAANAGQEASWNQAVEQGLLPDTSKKEWLTADDDKLCDDCDSLDGQQVDLDDDFESDSGETVETPPLHPNCRCSVGIVVGD